MERRHLLKTFAGLALCPLCVGGRAFAEAGHHWNYSQQRWGGVCNDGSRQSPIDITSATRVRLPDIQIGWATQASTILNNGHTIEVACGGSMTRGNEQYQLLQFHFHHPSEHRINSQGFAMEVHFVHARQGGGRGVIAAFMTRGAANAAFAAIAGAMPPKDKSVNAPQGVNPRNLIPRGPLRYYTYAGSLTTPTGTSTTPPTCEEDVTWMVLAQPIAVGAGDIAAFARLYRSNARLPQPIKTRMVMVSS
jgi:carbonic anhydrase